ncbi:T6SS effector BTH_I2691 family protein [Luteimonas sp. A501]
MSLDETAPTPEQEMQAEPTCDEQCPHFRIGFPLFLARYAILPEDAPLPALPQQVASASDPVKTIPLGGAARYALRLLRAGYVYVFDENRNTLEGYQVDDNALLFNLHLDSPKPPVDVDVKPCTLTSHLGNATCITIPDATRATRPIWIAYSEVEWTRAVRDAHKNDAGVRRKGMVPFDVKAWLASQRQPGAMKVGEAARHLAEFGLFDQDAKSALQSRRHMGWSSVPPLQSGWRAPGLAFSSERLLRGLNRGKPDSGKVQGAVLALPDPTAVARDLALLMKSRYDAHLARSSVKRPLAVSTAILQIKAASRNQFELRELAAAEQLSNEQMGKESWLTYRAIDWAFGTNQSERAMQRVEALRTVTPAELDRHFGREWTKYTDKYDEPARARWQATFDAALKEFDASRIAPLALAHAAWMKSEAMANCFGLQYDPDDPEQGMAYTVAVLLCLSGTQDKQACFNTYLEWLRKNDCKDKRNLLLRALLFNQTVIIDAVQKQLDAGLDPRAFPWSDVIALYEESLKAMADGSSPAVAKLVEQLMGPMMKALDSMLDSRQARAVGVALGLVSGKAVIPVTEVGGRKVFRASLIRQMIRLHGVDIGENQMQRAVAAELRRLEVHGVAMDGTDRKTWLLLIDVDQARSVPTSLASRERADQLARALRTPTQVEANQIANWKSTITRDVRLGTVGGLLQTWCLTSLWKDVATSMPHQSDEAIGRFSAGVLGAVGTTSEVTGKYIGNRFADSVRHARLPQAGRLLVTLGTRASIVAGVAMSVFDGIRAYRERQEGNVGMAWAYLGSALLGVGVMIAFALGGPIGILIGAILLALLFAVTTLIELFKDNKFQDWLERCFQWGKLVDRRYGNLDLEMRALEAAYEG